MSYILNIETATNICSVSLSKEGEHIAELHTTDQKSHAAKITLLIEELLQTNNLCVQDIDAFAISKGPGSYTGLRIGVSTAKGLCYGTDKPLIAINTLEAMAGQYVTQNTIAENDLLVPMLDARRMEVYTAVFDTQLNCHTETKAIIVDEQSFATLLKEHTLHFFGNSNEKVQGVIQHPNAHFNNNFQISAEGLSALAYHEFLVQEFEDIAYFEPFYLKDFVAIKAKNKVLGNTKK